TWTQVLTEGDAVEQVAVHGTVLVAVTATYDPQACTSGDCPAGTRQLVLADPTDTDWRDDIYQDLGNVEAAEVLGTTDVQYAVARQSAEGPVTRVLRLQDD